MIGQKRYPNSREGGIDIVVQHLAEEFVKLGHEVTLLVRRKKGYNPPSEYNGVKIKKIFTLNSKRLDALVYSYFATRYAKKTDADIIHFHALGNTRFLKKLRNVKNKKIVVTIHGLDWKRGKFKGLGTKVLLKSEKAVVKYADEIITLCENDNTYYKEKYNRQTTIIPNGINQQPVIDANIIKEKYGLEKDSYILFLSRIVPEKGLDYLIDAYDKVDCPKHKLVVAGGGSHSRNYFNEMKSKASNNKNIIFTGFVQGDKLNELFSNAYLYVLPSTIEGMPISLIEALSYKNICLCSDIKELVDIHSQNILYFKSKNVDDLKTKLEALMDKKPLYKEEKIFLNWGEVAKKTIDVYRK